MFLKKILFVIIILVLTRCSFQVSPWDANPENYDLPQKLTAKNIIKIKENWENKTDKDSLVVLMISDSHSWYKDLKKAVNAINKEENVDFVFHGGDMTEVGNILEYKWFYDEIKHLKLPWITIPGNHDGLNNGITIYHKVFGSDLNYFNLNFNDTLQTSFYLVNDNTMEIGTSNKYKKQFEDFIISNNNNQITDYKTFMAHVNPWNDVYFSTSDELYLKNIMEINNFSLFVHGHIHRYAYEDHYQNGIYYLSIDVIEARNYIRFVYFVEDGEIKIKHQRIFY